MVIVLAVGTAPIVLCDIVVVTEPLKVVPDAAPEPALSKVTACEVCAAVIEVVANDELTTF